MRWGVTEAAATVWFHFFVRFAFSSEQVRDPYVLRATNALSREVRDGRSLILPMSGSEIREDQVAHHQGCDRSFAET
jgi:hypothetical protein